MIDKSEVKQAVLHNVGCDADDWLEAARKGSAGFEGAKHALREAAKHVQAIVSVVDDDLEKGQIAELDGPLQIADYAKKQIVRAVDSLVNASRNYDNRQVASQGEIAAYERVIKYLAAKQQEEVTKLETLRKAIESGEIKFEEDGSMSPSDEGGNKARPSGVRPSQGIAAERRAEAATKGDPPKPSEPDTPPVAESADSTQKKLVPKPAKKQATKRRGGRPKGSKNRPKSPDTTPDAPNP